MQNLVKALVAISTVLVVSGCKTVKIENGEVPSQYLSQAKKLEGTYRGSFNGVRGNLIISFQGNRPTVRFSGNGGDDILNNNCDSDIGLLTKVTIKDEKKNPTVSNAVFEFSPGKCSLNVQGRTIDIGVKEKNGVVTLTPSILYETRPQEVCQWNPGAPPNVPPRQDCRTEYQSTYLTGSFAR